MRAPQAPQAATGTHEHTSLLDHVLRYMQRGLRAVILHECLPDGTCSCGNRNDTCPSPTGKDSTGKHPRETNWLKNLIVDEEAATKAWGKYPTANIGLCPREDEIVLDIDPRHGGDETFVRLVAELGEPEGPHAHTGGGGEHYWMKLPPGTDLKTATRRINAKLKALGPGIDLRTCRHQVVVEPSMHKSGRRYQWAPGRSILECEPVVPSTGWLRALGITGDSGHTGRAEKSESFTGTSADNLTRARWGLMHARLLNPDRGYEDWFRIGAALKCFGDEGLSLWIEASRTSKDFDETEIRRKWPGITGSSVASLFGMFDDAAPNWRERFRSEASQPSAASAAPEGADDADGPQLGQRDPKSGRLVLCPRKTLPTAEAFVRAFYSHPSGRTLRTYGGSNFVWSHACYRKVEDDAIRQQLQRWLHAALRAVVNKGATELVPFDSNPTTVNHAFLTTQRLTLVPDTTEVPSWLEAPNDNLAPRDILVCRSSMLHVPTGRILPPTPALFTFNALDFDYTPKAPRPTRWLAFLAELFGDDIQSIEALQDWFGYCLTADTRQQKILLIVGPKRSGKGTIARVLGRLLGRGNIVSPTVSSLAGTFGLQPLLGKSVAIVSDARFNGDHIGVVVERLLCISGEDAITVDVKFKDSVTVKLPVRFVFLSNELPRFTDASTALAGRFVLLQLAKSFYGQEDIHLTDALLNELPGILLWALDGWHRLHQRGHFVVPESSKVAMQDLEDLSSPVGAFVRARCVVGHSHRVGCSELYRAWCIWCDAEGGSTHTANTAFGRDLAAVVPGIRTRRSTGQSRFYEGIGLRPGEQP